MSERAKVVTFFNEKGGTGKTTFTALFASWLAYRKHEKVYAYDLDYPLYQLSAIRQFESGFLQSPKSAGTPFSRMTQESLQWFYPVIEVARQETFTPADLEKLGSAVRRQCLKAGGGYILMDFPGRYLPSDPIHYLSRKGLIDLVVFPIDSDRQSRGSALSVYGAMNRNYEIPGGRQNGVFLWNREAWKERIGKKDWYSESEAIFSSLGIPVAGARMRDIIIARRDASTFGFIRNTMCWPSANIAKACPYLEKIFEELKARTDGVWNDDMREALYGKD